jgi:hypothetical protein
MNRLNLVLILTGICVYTGIAEAQTTWDVGGGNNDFATLAAALASATVVDDDILEVYADQIADHTADKRLTIRSANPGTPVDINRITLSAGASGSTIEDVVLSNSGGVGSDHTVILEYVASPGTPVSANIARCTITAVSHGVLVNGGTLNISDASISGGDYGIGQEFPGGSITMTNTAITGSAVAGLNISDISTVTGNDTTTVDGANIGMVLAAAGTGTVAVSGITFTGSVTYGAHVVSANSGAQFNVTSCDIVNGLAQGFAIEANDASVILSGCTISNHETAGVGGGVGIFSGMENVTLVIEDSVMNNNHAVALILGDQASNSVTIRRSTFSCPSFYLDDSTTAQALGVLSIGPGNLLIEDNCSFTDLNVAVNVWEAAASIVGASFERNGTALSTSGQNLTTTNCTFAGTNVRAVNTGLVSLTDYAIYTDAGSTFQSLMRFQFNSQNTFNGSNIQYAAVIHALGRDCNITMNACTLTGAASMIIRNYTSGTRPVPGLITLNDCMMETGARFVLVEGEGSVVVNGGTFTGACGDVMLNVNHPLGVISLNGAGDSQAEKLNLNPVISGGTIIVGRASAGTIAMKNVTASVKPTGFLESWSDAGQGSLLGNVNIEYDQCAFFNGSGCYNANLNGTLPASYTITVDAMNTVWTNNLSQLRILGINAQDGLIGSASINLEHCTLTASANVLIDGNVSFDSVTTIPGRDTLNAQYCLFDSVGHPACSGTIALNGNGNLVAPGTVENGGFLLGQPVDTVVVTSAGVDRNTGLLLTGSAAINSAATSTATVDYRGVSRPYGTANDIGAHEKYEIPATPENLSASAHFDQYITLYWTDKSYDEIGFSIERRVDVGSWEQVTLVGANIESWQDMDVLASTMYTYRVRAYNAGQSSEFSNEADTTTSAGSGLAVAVAGPTIVVVEEEGYVELTVVAQGETGTVAYQWYFNDGIHGPVVLTGEDSASLVIPIASYANDGIYWCEVTDDVEAVSSASITLVVMAGVPVTGVMGILIIFLVVLVSAFAVLQTGKKKFCCS